ncbi:MAG TPA: hypothetical protein VGN09_05590 [Vicinamibacteria bacterium]|jgi:hypothetical protein
MDVKGHLLAFVRALVEADAVRLEVAGGAVTPWSRPSPTTG